MRKKLFQESPEYPLGRGWGWGRQGDGNGVCFLHMHCLGGFDSHSLMTHHSHPLRWVRSPLYGWENRSGCHREVFQFLKTYVTNKLSSSMFWVFLSAKTWSNFTFYGLLLETNIYIKNPFSNLSLASRESDTPLTHELGDPKQVSEHLGFSISFSIKGEYYPYPTSILLRAGSPLHGSRSYEGESVWCWRNSTGPVIQSQLYQRTTQEVWPWPSYSTCQAPVSAWVTQGVKESLMQTWLCCFWLFFLHIRQIRWVREP